MVMIPVNYRNIFPDKYLACDDGNIYNKSGKLIKPYLDKRGYNYIRLQTYNRKTNTVKRRNFPKYRIIAACFNGSDRPEMTIDHLDCNKLNDTPSNLEYVTFQENIDRARKNGLWTPKKYDFADETIHKMCKCFVQGMNVRKALRYCNIEINKTTTQFGIRLNNRSTYKNIIKNYDWDPYENTKKVYHTKDLESIAALVIYCGDFYTSKEIAEYYPIYDQVKLICVIKKLRQRKLYKDILLKIISTPLSQCLIEDCYGNIILVRKKKLKF